MTAKDGILVVKDVEALLTYLRTVNAVVVPPSMYQAIDYTLVTLNARPNGIPAQEGVTVPFPPGQSAADMVAKYVAEGSVVTLPVLRLHENADATLLLVYPASVSPTKIADAVSVSGECLPDEFGGGEAVLVGPPATIGAVVASVPAAIKARCNQAKKAASCPGGGTPQVSTDGSVSCTGGGVIEQTSGGEQAGYIQVTGGGSEQPPEKKPDQKPSNAGAYVVAAIGTAAVFGVVWAATQKTTQKRSR